MMTDLDIVPNYSRAPQPFVSDFPRNNLYVIPDDKGIVCRANPVLVPENQTFTRTVHRDIIANDKSIPSGLICRSMNINAIPKSRAVLHIAHIPI